ncbi:hypothetical protein, partial [Frankia sp. ACN1ag]|uniref:hypothetical protein n=1 Tax=Frankia sp. ACN1ag TaxID=102891 RepID=UPI001F32E434
MEVPGATAAGTARGGGRKERPGDAADDRRDTSGVSLSPRRRVSSPGQLAESARTMTARPKILPASRSSN